MFEKITVKLLKGFAAVVYACLLTAILSTPVIFIYQAFKEPIFTLTDTVVYEEIKEDQYLASIGEEPANWKKIDYCLTACAGRFSPYFYRIEKFEPTEDSALSGFRQEYLITLDEPLYFTNVTEDEFVISVYIRAESSLDVREISKQALFRAVECEKGFFEFSITV